MSPSSFIWYSKAMGVSEFNQSTTSPPSLLSKSSCRDLWQLKGKILGIASFLA